MSARNISRAPILYQIQENFIIKEENSEENNTKTKIPSGGIIFKDRSIEIPVETSIKYMNSEAYKITYGDNPVWKLYRRNFKGQFAPRKTRKTCIRGGIVSTGNPCPICRDEYLIIDYKNTKLLNQFISPHNGETLCYRITNICQKQHKNLLVALKKAKNCGIVTFDPPHRKYNYSHWYNSESKEN
ncbi:28S ribosomal protein S18b, mitochondrial isoform X2 [Leptopilina boulardi]|nr:28S ribosomal protein S18b, mitochondrial isoform X2 [Leptopilina boulardi]